MKESELKNVVFQRFEERRMEIIKKRNSFQQELDQDVYQFRLSYGDAAVYDLGNLELAVTPTENQPARERERPAMPAPKRPRTQRKRGQHSQLEKFIPAAIEAVTATKKEFQAYDVHEILKNNHGVSVDYRNVSFYLRQNVEKLGLSVEKRNSGEPIPRPTNFFCKKKSTQQAPNNEKAKRVGPVDWTNSITLALWGLRKGLTQLKLKEKLMKQGVPEAKFKGVGFKNALSRLVEEGAITFQNDKYRI